MNVLGIIPARAGSQRLPGKNTKILGGEPLVVHIIESALQASTIDHLVVNTDSDEILNIATRYPIIKALRRPIDLATHTAPAIDYVRHTLSNLKIKPDAIVILQPTSPLTLPEDIDATVNLLETTKADSAVSVVALDHMVHPYKLKTLRGDRLLPFLEEEDGRMAAHELPSVYVRNCAVYATRLHVIEQGHIIGDDCRAYVMPRERSVDINDSIDFAFAEFLWNRKQN